MTRFETLLEGYLSDDLGEAELLEFLDLLEANAGSMAEPILRDLQSDKYTGLTDPAGRQRMLTRILEQNRRRRPAILRPLVRSMAAAAILLCLAGGAWLWLHYSRGTNPVAKSVHPAGDVAPGGDKAILTLADGKTITLDSAANGLLASQGNTRVSKNNGVITYLPSSLKSSLKGVDEVKYNTITTPKGGQYQLILPDGSKVILNSASSLRYPTAFTASSRQVWLTGEGYFDIARSDAQPFTVQVGELEVRVLGTHFDIMAYGDEPTINTTLVEGAVQVRNQGQTQTVRPGQEAVLDKAAGALFVREADIDKALAWTTGFFKFDHSDLHSIMREVARWYDIDIVYEGGDNNEQYGGRIRRDLNLSVLIKFLESNGIHHFRIEGRKLIVLP